MIPKKTSISTADGVTVEGIMSYQMTQGYLIERDGLLLEQVLIEDATSFDVFQLSRRARAHYGPGVTIRRMTERQENTLSYYWEDLMLRRN